MKLFILPEKFTVCRLRSDAEFPYSVMHAGWWNITRTDDELSIVCPESYAPEEAEIEKGWRCLEVAGPLDFSEIGVLASLADPLAKTGISIFVTSTFNTDYVLVKQDRLAKAVRVLRLAGHSISHK